MSIICLNQMPTTECLGRSVVTMVQSSSWLFLEVADFNLTPPKYFITLLLESFYVPSVGHSGNLIYWIWKGMKIMFYWHWCCDVMWLRSGDLHHANLLGLSTSNLKLGRYRLIAAGIKKLINVGFSVLNGLFTVK